MIKRTTALTGFAVLAVIATGVATPGCEDQRRHQASEDLDLREVKAPIAADAPPEVAAKVLLLALRDMQVVRSEGLGDEDNRDRYDRALGEIVSLMDQRRVHELMRDPKRHSPMIPKNIESVPALKLVAESWTSMVAHYIDGISPAMQVSVAPVTRGATVTLRDGSKAQAPDETRVRATLINAREREIVTEIESDAALPGLRDGAGRLVAPGSPQWLAAVEPLALERGVHVPIETTVTLQLSRGKDGWRVFALSLEPASSATASPPTVLPVPQPRPVTPSTRPASDSPAAGPE